MHLDNAKSQSNAWWTGQVVDLCSEEKKKKGNIGQDYKNESQFGS